MDMELRKRIQNKNEQIKLIPKISPSTYSNSIITLLQQNILLISVVLRLFSCLVTQTFFVPDEYWQSTEVAHHKVFGYGYLTWEWKEKIRSYFYPFLFELYFRLLEYFSMDIYVLVRYGPHILQAVLTSFCDVSVFRLASKLTGCKEVAFYSYILHITSWFIFYTGSRTLSNTAEMCFSAIGLSYFPYTPKDLKSRKLVLAIIFGGIACIIRPTCLLIWAPLILSGILSRCIPILQLVLTCIYLLPLMLILSLGIDYYFFETLTIVHWNFVKFNILQNVGEFYGTHTFHWYLTQGLPVVSTIQLLFVVVGIMKSHRNVMSFIVFFYIFVHSFIAHKEFRFLLPIYPIMMYFAGYGFNHLIQKYFSSKKLWILVLMVNIPMAMYFCLVHQRGTIDVMNFLKNNLHPSNGSVLFLMPCHSTPYYSYLHQNITMRFLTCEPNTSPSYMCESDQFYNNPGEWLVKEFQTSYQFVIGYDILPTVAKRFLQSKNYSIVDEFFHSNFPEGNIGHFLHIYSNQ